MAAKCFSVFIIEKHLTTSRSFLACFVKKCLANARRYLIYIAKKCAICHPSKASYYWPLASDDQNESLFHFV